MKTIIRAVTVSLVLLIICGVIYPLGMTLVSNLIFPKQANGSVAKYDGKPVGSELLGQDFTDSRFFHGRISANNYSGAVSGSANLSSSNPALVERVKKDMDEFLKANPSVKKENIPADLLTSSGSGLDPHISPKAAEIQMPVISKATGISIPTLEKLVKKYTERRTLGIFGEDRFNILEANMEIKKMIK
jgi:potassium-transporting ATPase KdpC subunit